MLSSAGLQDAQHKRTESFGSYPRPRVYYVKNFHTAIFAQFRNLLGMNAVGFAPSMFDYPEKEPVAFSLKCFKKVVRKLLAQIGIANCLKLRTQCRYDLWFGK